MTIVLWCLFLIVILPYVLAGVGAYFRVNQLGAVDNNNPRAQAAELTGAGARAVAAQQNAWEAAAVFIAAVLVASLGDAEPEKAGMLAMGFVGFRILHAVCYIADWATPRSLVFVGGFVCAIWLFLLGL